MGAVENPCFSKKEHKGKLTSKVFDAQAKPGVFLPSDFGAEIYDRYTTRAIAFLIGT